MKPEGFIPPHGNYRELLSYQKAEVVYDITYRFCRKFLSKGDRTIDFLKKGGLRERMTRARLKSRQNQPH